MTDSSCNAFTGKCLVFWIRGRLWEVVAHGGSTLTRTTKKYTVLFPSLVTSSCVMSSSSNQKDSKKGVKCVHLLAGLRITLIKTKQCSGTYFWFHSDHKRELTTTTTRRQERPQTIGFMSKTTILFTHHSSQMSIAQWEVLQSK